MRPVGGFFELEIPLGKGSYHKNALALTNGRACLSLIIKEIKPHKLYVPYYTCNALLEPIKENNVKYEFYPINDSFDPMYLPELKKNEYFIYINYWGIKSDTVKQLMRLYDKKLILDNVQDFFSRSYDKVWSFTSARKYFGVPDGAYLYSPYIIERQIERNTEISLSHCISRLIGKQNVGFKQFLKYENSLTSEIKTISIVSDKLLSNINYSSVKKIRKENYNFFDSVLSSYNNLKINFTGEITPFCYPFLPEGHIDKNIFYRNGFFIPSYWLDTNKRGCAGFQTEKKFSRNLFPLPIDHRYNKEDLERVSTFLLEEVKYAKK